jgi:D-3-phosphoglycerate dehydrogenase
MSGETVLVSCVQLQRNLDRYGHLFEERGIALLVPPVVQQLREEELLTIVGEIDGMIAGDDQVTRAVLDRATRLRVISKWGIGTDAIDLTAATRLGIRVTNTPGVFGDEVADVVIGYMVMLARSLHHIDRGVRNEKWPKPEGVSLAGRTLGVIGLGDIGRAVCRRALIMGMIVLGVDVSAEARELAHELGVSVTDLDTTFASADVISLNCPLTAATRHMISGDRLRRMKAGAWIINTARGGLVDEEALWTALEDGQIGGAALDVFEVEPLPAASPLRVSDRVILGSHNSSNSTEAVIRTSDLAIANLFAGLDEVRR